MQITFLKKNTYLTSTAVLCGIFVALIGAATAWAGAPEMKEVAPAPPQEVDWNGIYLGFNAGVVFDNYSLGHYYSDVGLGRQLNTALAADPFDNEVETADDYFTSFYTDGHSGTDVAPIGGLHVGYKKQFGHFVAGLEFGFEGTQTSKGSESQSFQTNFFSDADQSLVEADSQFNSSRRAERNWDGWVGGQLGYAWGRFYFYGTGGYTFSDVTMYQYDRVKSVFYDDIDRGVAEFVRSQSSREYSNEGDIMNGWYAGGGAQYALNNRVTLGLEYRHSDFGDQTFRFKPINPIFPGATNVNLSSNQVEFIVNIMLGHLSQGH